MVSIFRVFYPEDGGSLFIRNVAYKEAYEKLKKENEASYCIDRSSGQVRGVPHALTRAFVLPR